MTHTFLWHDYETFGIHPAKDRPAQFAAIRTDAALNELGAPIMEYCQQTPDYVPSASACLVTGITPQICQAQGVPEYQFAATLEAAFSQPGTVGVGYNTLRFDDEFTRHLFWRNFIDPYAREWQNECSRWDLLDVVRAAHALRPEGLNWPVNKEGRPSFRLEHLTAANNITHQGAHDALIDVRATIELARRLRAAQPRLFDFCLSLRHKTRVLEEVGGVGAQGRPLLHISGMFAPEKGCLALVFPLAQHPKNKNEIIVWDLAEDPRVLLELDAQALRTRLFTRQDALPPGVRRMPIKTIHINKSPIIIRALNTLNPAEAEKWGIDVPQALRHAQHAQALPPLTTVWADVFAHPPLPPEDAEYALYSGFVSSDDRRQLNRWLGLDFATRIERLPTLNDPRLNTLLERYRARYAPESLNEIEIQAWHEHCHARLHAGEGSVRTLAQLDAEIATCRETATPEEHAVLNTLTQYADTLAHASERI